MTTDTLTNAEINERLAVELFGHTLVDPQPKDDPRWRPSNIRPSRDYLTGDGMIQIIEAMRERGWTWLTEVYPETDAYAKARGQDRHHATFVRDTMAGYQRAEAWCHSLPRAVALAALQALTEEKS